VVCGVGGTLLLYLESVVVWENKYYLSVVKSVLKVVLLKSVPEYFLTWNKLLPDSLFHSLQN